MKKSIRALRLDADGHLTPTTLEEDARGTHLEALDRNLGCDLVECVSLRGDLGMWIDEEGKLKDAPFNRGATKAMLSAGYPDSDFIAGIAVFTGGPDADGNMTDLDDPAAAFVEEIVNRRTLP
ncbi:MAG: hypothetical protein DLM66_12785 [Candidatus Dormiibacter spiritus]|nr:MAG: hypothetical protein DLM66_12785 [Candidatus Dormibacteraeota bacterium]